MSDTIDDNDADFIAFRKPEAGDGSEIAQRCYDRFGRVLRPPVDLENSDFGNDKESH